MGKRGRRRSGGGGRVGGLLGGAGGQRATGPGTTAPTTHYSDSDVGELELRGSLTARARGEYTAVLASGLDREDAWQRATELLFERLVISWTVSGVRTEAQKELLGRYRMASAAERRFVRDCLRAHLAENFPELEAP